MNVRRHLAALAAVFLFLLAGVPFVWAQTSFPQEITDPAGKIVVYQPQPESLKGNVLTGRAAMSLQPKGRSEPIFGAFWFTSIIDTDGETGMTIVRDIHVSKVRWTDSKEADEARFTEIVEAAAARSTLSVSTARLSASLTNSEREQKSLAELKNDPPKIIFENKLAVLLLYDGELRWSDVEKSSYERAINTPFLVMRDKRSKTCYLSSGKLWYSAKDPLGPWQSITKPPSDLVKMLPKDDSDAPMPGKPPAIVVVTEPTELVVSDGEPKWKPVGEGALLYVENTETPWIRELDTQQIYLLLSGRWFRAASTSGPWTFVRADLLPESFKKVPAGSDIGGVRVSVAGTEEAEDAVLDAAIPKTAIIKRSEAKLDIKYDGEPKFEKIPGTSVSLAINTASQVLEIGSKYYAVDNGVWFVATKPKGPWAVADKIPEDEIQKIPPSSPAYNVTYVHVYQSTPEVVYVGYYPGYVWSYPYYGVPVYGTGYYYPPPPYYYYPRPITYGLHVGYNPWSGWSFGMSWGVGFMHVGISFGGGYGCCGGWGGGYHGGHNNINIGGGNTINIGNNVNHGNREKISSKLRDNPKAGNLRQPSVYNQPAAKARNADPGTVKRNAQQARPARGVNNDVLADRDGNLSRRTKDGWEEREGNKWQNADRAAAKDKAQNFDRSSGQRDFQARERGGQREAMQRSAPRGRMSGGGRHR
jgi:hypothetical protein